MLNCFNQLFKCKAVKNIHEYMYIDSCIKHVFFKYLNFKPPLSFFWIDTFFEIDTFKNSQRIENHDLSQKCLKMSKWTCLCWKKCSNRTNDRNKNVILREWKKKVSIKNNQFQSQNQAFDNGFWTRFHILEFSPPSGER